MRERVERFTEGEITICQHQGERKIMSLTKMNMDNWINEQVDIYLWIMRSDDKFLYMKANLFLCSFDEARV